MAFHWIHLKRGEISLLSPFSSSSSHIVCPPLYVFLHPSSAVSLLRIFISLSVSDPWVSLATIQEIHSFFFFLSFLCSSIFLWLSVGCVVVVVWRTYFSFDRI
ncbi:hypothetical protein CSUI_009646 [Cystoisospora suis]|uniref:Transmembrane protein n=1 Tax=Cystoisospora suis TaxID=483139 RepID=A0A2C6KJJ8_9APIC|nr:hypothetical protein CSUI_009646 [Cystoisospora suis]